MTQSTFRSRGPNPFVPPLEKDGILYQQVEEGFEVGMPDRCGYLQAIDMASGKSLWVEQIYKVDYDDLVETDVQDEYFLRMKFRPGEKEILIETECRVKYLFDLATHKVRHPEPGELPPPVQRPPIPKVAPVSFRHMEYRQNMNAHQNGMGQRCGMLDSYIKKTNEQYGVYFIYRVPFNPDVEDDTQECYFTRMRLMPGNQDILIENEAGDKYLFNIKQRRARPLQGDEASYQPRPLSWRERLQDAWEELIFRLKK